MKFTFDKRDKLYFSSILDCCSNELITYQAGRYPDNSLMKKIALQAVLQLSNGETPILHSDQGIHYQTLNYSKTQLNTLY